ncbi:MAG: hypothetical protein H0V70_21200 [Ktedonobacteraceae bacterium]|nr:hypothetical protein [Ktedonobacteraceae bacterium]
MTTPHIWKGGGFSGLLLKAPSEPKNPVATTPGGLWALRDLTYRLAQQTIGTLLLLPTGTIYRGTCKQY